MGKTFHSKWFACNKVIRTRAWTTLFTPRFTTWTCASRITTTRSTAPLSTDLDVSMLHLNQSVGGNCHDAAVACLPFVHGIAAVWTLSAFSHSVKYLSAKATIPTGCTCTPFQHKRWKIIKSLTTVGADWNLASCYAVRVLLQLSKTWSKYSLKQHDTLRTAIETPSSTLKQPFFRGNGEWRKQRQSTCFLTVIKVILVVKNEKEKYVIWVFNIFFIFPSN